MTMPTHASPATPAGDNAAPLLWSDTDIANDAKRASSNPTEQAKIRACLLFMRHGYEQELATLRADGYEAGMRTEREHQEALARFVEQKHQEEVDTLRAEVEQLRQQLAEAQRWEMVELPKTTQMHNCMAAMLMAVDPTLKNGPYAFCRRRTQGGECNE